MKKVITEMTKDSIIVTISADGYDDCIFTFPVALVSPQISLQVAGMLAADPMLAKPKNDE